MQHTLSFECPHGTIDDSLVWFVETALFDHLILVLDQQLHTLDRRSCSLGDDGRSTAEGKVLREPEFLPGHLKMVTNVYYHT